MALAPPRGVANELTDGKVVHAAQGRPLRPSSRRSRGANARGMQTLHECLDELGLEYLPSHTNFVMHRIRGSLTDYNARMLEHGFRVGRQFPPMTNFSRISIGMPQDMERFADTLQTFRTKGWI